MTALRCIVAFVDHPSHFGGPTVARLECGHERWVWEATMWQVVECRECGSDRA